MKTLNDGTKVSDSTPTKLVDGKRFALTKEEVAQRKKEEVKEKSPTQILMKVRPERDRLLMESDWTQLPDAGLTEAIKTKWAAYRLALRDIPQKIESGEMTGDNLVWPEKPA